MYQQVGAAVEWCAIAYYVKHYHVPATWGCRPHWAGYVAPTSRFTSGGLCHLGGSTGASLPWHKVWRHWSVDAGDRALPQHLIDDSISEWRHHLHVLWI